MAKEKFNWKSLFINETEEETSTSKKEQPETKSTSSAPTTSFPNTQKSGPQKPVTKFPEQNISKTAAVDQATLNKIVEMYESGFESLNTPGYDFYEFFKAIKAVSSNDPSIYKMALTMATSVDPNVTKDSLLKQADYYINEIEKVHKKYDRQGNQKKNQILKNQKEQKNTLQADIAALEKNLMEIQHQISVKKNQLQSIDTDVAHLTEIDQKIMANNTAKSKILETIMTVVNGIKINL